MADIREHGLREPIWLHKDGSILDGRRRYRACGEAGVKLHSRTYTGPDDGLVAFVISMNLHRRHLNESQGAMVAARVATMRQGGRTDLAQICAKSQPEVAALFNVSRRLVQTAQRVQKKGVPALIKLVDNGTVAVSDAARIVDLPAAEQDRSVERVTTGLNKTLAGAHRAIDIQQQKRAIEAGTAKLPEGVFEVIVIDPPWPGENTPYPPMSLDEIRAIELPAAPDCVLWLWTTHRFLLRHVSPLLDAWGFEDKATVTWDKGSIGPGSYLRYQSEFCIMATRGHPRVDLTNQPTIIRAQRREHSRKPDEFFEMVESLCIGRRLDMFSREQRVGWAQFGNDLNKFKRAA